MKRTILYTLFVLLLLALTGCVQVRDSWLPEPEPPAVDPGDQGEPEEPVEPEPGEQAALLTFPMSAAGLPLNPDGTVAVNRIEVTVRSTVGDAGGMTAQSTADLYRLQPGESVEIELEPGEYGLESSGYGGASDQLIAYGQSAFTLDADTEGLDIDLGLTAVIAGVDLLVLPARETVMPGDQPGFSLVARSVDPALTVPPEAFTADFQLDAGLGELTPSGTHAAIVQLAAELPDTFRIAASGTGLGLAGTEPQPDMEFEAALELPVGYPADTGPAWLPPRITFDPPAAATLGGQLGAGQGHTHVQVFHDDQLLGSSRAAEHLQDSTVAQVSFSGGSWSMNWQAGADTSYTLRAVAQDLHGNSAVAYQSINVTPPADPDDLQTYRTVSGASGTDPDAPETFPDLGACAANEFSLPGQGLQAVGAGLQAVGAVGGLSFVPAAGLHEKTAYGIGKEHTAVLTKWSGQFIDDMPTSFRMLGDARDTVLILVVDDYGEANYTLPRELLDAELSPEQLQELTDSGELTHGALVLHHTLQNLNAMTNLGDDHIDEYFNQTTGEPYYVYRTPQIDLENPELTEVPVVSFIVQPVNTAGRDVDQLGGYIRDSISGLGQFVFAVERIVMNFSFVIMPCSITADFAASGISSFEDYAEAVAAINGMPGESGQIVEVSTSGGSYGLAEFLACPSGQPDACNGGVFERFSHLVSVASAGNYGLDYPLYPAAEPGVIAVGAVPTVATGHGGAKSSYSNSANVLAPGSLILSSRNDMAWRYDGTSFAAPSVSTFLAGDLAVVEGMACFGEPNMEPDGPRPPGFASADLSDIILYDWYGRPEALSSVCLHDHSVVGH